MFEKLFKSKSKKKLEPLKTSPGKLRTYLQCPRKYKYLYIDNQKNTTTTSTGNLVFDSALNKALEKIQKHLDEHPQLPDNTEFRNTLFASWNPGDYTDSNESERFRAATSQTADRMWEWFTQNHARVVRYRGEPAIGIFLAWYPSPITVWTRIDRVEKHSDNHIRIIDFKSGARQMTASELKSDLGARIQAAAAIEQFGNDVTRMALVYLRTGDTIEVSTDDMELDRLEADIFDIASSIQNDGFPPHPGPLCSVCEFLENCSGWKTLPWKTCNESRETYKQRLRLSYSKMSLYERCPLAYKKLYVDGIPPKPQPFFSYGSCIHAVMEDFYAADQTEKRSLDLLLSLLEKQWRNWRIGYRSEDEESLYKQKALRMLQDYFNRFVKNQKFAPAAYIESYFELPVGPGSIMTGFIDRIDQLPSGGHIVLDYKTEPTDRSQESVDQDLQLTLYYWAAREFMKLDIRELGLFMMSHDKLTKTVRTSGDIPAMLDRINEVTRKIRSETQYPPAKNKYCLSCDHLVGCPLEQEIRTDPKLRTMEYTDTDLEPSGATDE